MLALYKRKAWLLDEEVLLEGYTAKRKFVPDNFDCGFSYQKICKRDIGNILFYKRHEALSKIGGREVAFTCGDSIEYVVNELLAHRAAHTVFFGKFNDVYLYSDTVTMDAAYKEITGKIKSEFDKMVQESRERYAKEKLEHAEKIPELTVEWQKKGREILTEDKLPLWDEVVPIRLNDLYQGMELGSCLDIVKILNSNGTLDEAKEEIERQSHSGISFGLVCSMVKAFCSRGDDFVAYVKL